MFLTIAATLAGTALFLILLFSFVSILQNAGAHTALKELTSIARSNNEKLSMIERFSIQINSLLMSDFAAGGGGALPEGTKELFTTNDGKHISTSLEELIKKIMTDPTYQKKNAEEIDKLRDLFEKENTKDDDEPNPDEDEPWKGDKK